MANPWLQVVVNGLASGLALALFALAFGVVYVSSGKFHLSLCAVFATTPTIAWALRRSAMSWPAALTCAIATGISISLATGVLNHERLEKRQGSDGAHFISALGLYLLLTQALVLVFGSESKMLRSGLDLAHPVGPVTLTMSQVLTAGVSCAILFCFLGTLRFTRAGLFLRAISDNPAECALRGINVTKVRVAVFALAGGLCSASSLLVGSENGFDPNGGLLAGLPAIAAMIIGGRTSFVGPVFGALLIAMVRVTVVWSFSAGWQEAVTFVLLAAFLLFRPQGLVSQPGPWERGL